MSKDSNFIYIVFVCDILIALRSLYASRTTLVYLLKHLNLRVSSSKSTKPAHHHRRRQPPPLPLPPPPPHTHTPPLVLVITERSEAVTSQKYAYIMLTPLNSTFVQ